MFARLHPGLSTAQDVVKLSAQAGAKSAACSAAFAGSISIISNLVAVSKGDKSPEVALGDVAKDTGSAAVVGGTTGFVGSAIQGAMRNAASDTVRTLSKTNLAATIVTATMGASKSLSRYIQGDIDGVQCFEELGEQGYGMISSAMFAVVGQAVIPIPAVGAIIGSMVGYSLASASYGLLLESQKEAKLIITKMYIKYDLIDSKTVVKASTEVENQNSALSLHNPLIRRNGPPTDNPAFFPISKKKRALKLYVSTLF